MEEVARPDQRPTGRCLVTHIAFEDFGTQGGQILAWTAGTNQRAYFEAALTCRAGDRRANEAACAGDEYRVLLGHREFPEIYCLLLSFFARIRGNLQPCICLASPRDKRYRKKL